MRILLMNMPRDGQVQENLTPSYIMVDYMSYPPLGLLAIAADVDRRHDIQVLDTENFHLTIDEAVARILAQNPDLVGMSVVTWRLFPMFDIARKIKAAAPHIKIVTGGPHPTDYPREVLTLGCVDYVLTGFGEKSFPRLVEALDNGEDLLRAGIHGLYFKKDDEIKCTLGLEGRLDLDTLPFPNRKLVNLKGYFTLADEKKMTTTYSSRGCPFKCTFCDVALKKYFVKSGKRIAEEFEDIVKLGFREVHIFDDTFNLDRQRVIEMCEEILRRGLKITWTTRARVKPCDDELMTLMKRSGCKRLHVGVEALDDVLLEKMRKSVTVDEIRYFFSLAKKYEIDTLAYFIVGFDEETQQYRENLFEQIRSLGVTYVYMNKLQALNGTEHYRNLIADGRYKTDFWKDFVNNPVRDFHFPSYRTPEEDAELNKLVDSIHRRFYLSPRFVLLDIRRTKSPTLLLRKVKAAVKLMLRAA